MVEIWEKNVKRGQAIQRSLLSVFSVVRRLYLTDFGDSRTDVDLETQLEEL